MKDSKIFFNL